MTETTAINSANPYAASAEDILAGEVLSGEALMFYISTRINSLDDAMSELMGMQQDALKQKQFLQEVKAWAREHQEFHTNYDGDYSDFHAADKSHLSPFPGRPEGDPLHDLSQQITDDFRTKIADPSISKEAREFAYEEFITRIDQMIEQVDGQSELNMIRLQQVLGQRQTALQLTTNILSKYNAGQEAIVGNLR